MAEMEGNRKLPKWPNWKKQKKGRKKEAANIIGDPEYKAFACNLVINIHHYCLRVLFQANNEYEKSSPLYSEHCHQIILHFLDENWKNFVNSLNKLYALDDEVAVKNFKTNLEVISRESVAFHDIHFVVCAKIAMFTMFMNYRKKNKNEDPIPFILNLIKSNVNFQRILYENYDEERIHVKGFLNEVFKRHGMTLDSILDGADKKLSSKSVTLSDYAISLLDRQGGQLIKRHESEYGKNKITPHVFYKVITGYNKDFIQTLSEQINKQAILLDYVFIKMSIFAIFCGTQENAKELNTLALDGMQRVLKFVREFSPVKITL